MNSAVNAPVELLADRGYVLTPTRAVWPQRCVRCNVPGTESVLVNVAYREIGGVMGAVLTGRLVSVAVTLCPSHARIRRIRRVIGAALVAAGLVGVAVGGGVDNPDWAIVGMEVGVVGVIVAGAFTSLLKVAHVAADHAWVIASPDFVAGLPVRPDTGEDFVAPGLTHGSRPSLD